MSASRQYLDIKPQYWSANALAVTNSGNIFPVDGLGDLQIVTTIANGRRDRRSCNTDRSPSN